MAQWWNIHKTDIERVRNSNCSIIMFTNSVKEKLTLWSARLSFWWWDRPWKLSHFITKHNGKLVLSLIDDKSRKVPLMIILCNKLSEFLSLNWAPRILMGFEQHVSDNLSNKLILFLKYESKSNQTIKYPCSQKKIMTFQRKIEHTSLEIPNWEKSSTLFAILQVLLW